MLVRHNEQNIERLAHLSIIDPLTKAYNRGYLKDVMVSEINRCRRSGLPLTSHHAGHRLFQDVQR